MSFREDDIEHEFAQMNFGELDKWETMFQRRAVDADLSTQNENSPPDPPNINSDAHQQHIITSRGNGFTQEQPDVEMYDDGVERVNETNYLRFGTYINSFCSTHMIPRPYEGEIDWESPSLVQRCRTIQTILHFVEMDRTYRAKLESHKELQSDFRREQQDYRNKVKQITTELKAALKESKSLSNKLKMKEQATSTEIKKLKGQIRSTKKELDDARALVKQQNRKIVRSDLEISRAQQRIEEFMQRTNKRVKPGSMRISNQSGRTSHMEPNLRNQLEGEKQLMQEQIDSLHQRQQESMEENSQLRKGLTDNEVKMKEALSRMSDILGGEPIDTTISHGKYAQPYSMGKAAIRDNTRRDIAQLNEQLDAFQSSFNSNLQEEMDKLRQENESLKSAIREHENVQMYYMGNNNRIRESPHDRRRMSVQRDEFEEQNRVLEAKKKVLDEQAQRVKQEKQRVLEMKKKGSRVYPASSELSDPFLDELDDDLLGDNFLTTSSSNLRSNSPGSISGSVSTGSSRANKLRVDTTMRTSGFGDFDMDGLDDLGFEEDADRPLRNIQYDQDDDILNNLEFEYDF